MEIFDAVGMRMDCNQPLTVEDVTSETVIDISHHFMTFCGQKKCIIRENN